MSSKFLRLKVDKITHYLIRFSTWTELKVKTDKKVEHSVVFVRVDETS